MNLDEYLNTLSYIFAKNDYGGVLFKDMREKFDVLRTTQHDSLKEDAWATAYGVLADSVTGFTKIPPGTAPILTPVSATAIDLAWTAAVAPATVEDVYRAEGSGAIFPDDYTLAAEDILIATAAFSDTGLTPGTNFVYRILPKAVAEVGFPSEAAGLTTALV